MTTANIVAKYIIQKFQDAGDPVTNLKLQKLLYYVQGWHLGIYNEPAFDEDFQAWVHGPVIPEVFQVYKRHSWNPIVNDEQLPELDARLQAHIDDTLDAYGGDSGWALEIRTHRESPWIDARGSLPQDVSSNQIITKESMHLFFSEFIEENE